MTDAECGKCDARASPTAPPYPPPPRYSATAWRRGCRAAVAHSCFSAVRSPSCEGKLPPRSFPLRDLREGRRSGRSWGNGDGHRGWQVRRACSPYAPPYPPPPRYSATAWRRGCRAAVAHSISSLVSSPNCVGTLPVRPWPPRSLREGHRSGRRGQEGCPWTRGASDLRRAADARCALPLRDATTLRHHSYAMPPSVPPRRRSPNPAAGDNPPRWCMVNGARCNGAHRVVPL